MKINGWLHIRRVKGFSVLELLVVVVVLGVLATLALVRFGDVSEKAFVATMKHDLRNFATARALHQSNTGVIPLTVEGTDNFSFSENVSEVSYTPGTSHEWKLVVGHARTDIVCTITSLDDRKERIVCSPDGQLEFAASATSLVITVDATDAVAEIEDPSTIASIRWEWGDGQSTTGTHEELTTTSHPYAQEGEYRITLTLVKSTGEWLRGSRVVRTENFEEESEENETPEQETQADFVMNPSSPEVGQLVTVTSTSTNASEGDLLFTWYINDEIVSSEENYSFTLTEPGEYKVTLTIVDSFGFVSSNTNVFAIEAVASGNILYVSAADYSLYVMEEDGSKKVRLTNGIEVEHASWSPDGSKILFTGDGNFYLIDADGSNMVQITNGLEDREAFWSPDGSKIMFTTYRHGTVDIYVMDADGTNESRIVQDARLYSRPLWSPDGNKILYKSWAGMGEIHIVNRDGSGKGTVPGITWASAPSWGPDGRIVFSASLDPEWGGNDIYTVSTNGTNLTRLTFTMSTDVIDDDKLEDNPMWSSDGSKIYYTAIDHWTTGNNILFVMNSDGSGKTPLRTTGWTLELPGFSAPDGRLVTTISSDWYGDHYYIMNPDGSNRIPLADGEAVLALDIK